MIEWAVNDAADVINQSTSRRRDVNQLCGQGKTERGGEVRTVFRLFRRFSVWYK